MDRGAKYRFKLFKTRYGREIIEKYRVQEQPVAYSDLPTFWEFVEYLLHTPPWEYNEHWRPYYLVCSPCHHHYNIIMHLETLEEDVKYLVNVTGFPELAPGQTHKTKINLVPARDGEEEPEEEKLDSVSDSRTSLEASFYRDVSMEQLTRLYEVYKIDFEMFGYDISPYDKYVRR